MDALAAGGMFTTVNMSHARDMCGTCVYAVDILDELGYSQVSGCPQIYVDTCLWFMTDV